MLVTIGRKLDQMSHGDKQVYQVETFQRENWKQFAGMEYYYGDDSRSAIRPSWNARFNDSITSLCIESSYLEQRMVLYAILLSIILFGF